MSINIKQFIKERATAQSIAKAKHYTPRLVSHQGTQFLFKCQGNDATPYQISIDIDDDIDIFCSCPYNFSGICKHAVACLQALEKNLGSDFLQQVPDLQQLSNRYNHSANQNPNQGQRLPKLVSQTASKTAKPSNKSAKKPSSAPRLSYPLDDNQTIDVERIIDDFTKHHIRPHDIYVYDSSIRQFIPSERIEVSLFEYNDSVTQQTFSRDAKTNTIELQCSCKARNKSLHCAHLLHAFAHVINEIGPDFLQDNYLDNQISGFLAQYGLTLEDDYQPYFDFSVDQHGVSFEKKVPNLLPISVFKTDDMPEVLPSHLRKKHPVTSVLPWSLSFLGALF